MNEGVLNLLRQRNRGIVMRRRKVLKNNKFMLNFVFSPKATKNLLIFLKTASHHEKRNTLNFSADWWTQAWEFVFLNIMTWHKSLRFYFHLLDFKALDENRWESYRTRVTLGDFTVFFSGLFDVFAFQLNVCWSEKSNEDKQKWKLSKGFQDLD